MNILIVGSGAREHAIACTLMRSARKPTLFCCGTALNPGIKQTTHSYWIGDICDVAAVVAMAKQWEINLCIIGPEAPLAEGLADALWDAAIPTIGPKKSLAAIETSKSFARDLMQKYDIAGQPRYQSFNSMQDVPLFLNTLGEGNYVVKANGLMGGKGVKVAGDHLHSIAEAITFCESLHAAGHAFVIEEKLIGQEFSFMAFCDGAHLIPMPIVQDHKRAFNGDAGPNTGGMGSYSDADHKLPFLTDSEVKAATLINEAIVQALHAELNEKYIGILYGSFIATARGVYVIEFNARFGDPESLNVLTILSTDFVDVCQAMVMGELAQLTLHFEKKATVCKYAVPEGYPDEPLKNALIDISAVKNKANLYLGAVDVIDNKLIATGSRTAAYVGVADSLVEAEQMAETEISAIEGPLFHREDIGTLDLIQLRITMMQGLRDA